MTGKDTPWSRIGIVLLAAGLLGGSTVRAHSPIMDSKLTDWCVGAPSNTAAGGGRVEDSSATLTCGNCSTTTTRACEVNSDCPGGESCVNLTSKTEVVWWDNRTDGAVNDLGTVVITTDATKMYIGAELWVDPDPVSLPFAEIAIDWKPGGIDSWWDPLGKMKAPGRCSGFTDRACTGTINNPANPEVFDDTNMDGVGDRDCHFCQISEEPFPSTRKRACGSACDPDIGDVCNRTQTCVFPNSPAGDVGVFSNPETLPDTLLVFDFSRWLIGFGNPDATEVRQAVGGVWTPGARFQPAVNPGASGGSGGPPGSVEVAIPLADLGAGFTQNTPFRFSIVVARGTLTLDYVPDGAVEDVMSEANGGSWTTTPNDCPGFGVVTTECEIADGSADAFIPPVPKTAGGRTNALRLDKTGARGAPLSLTLNWNPSCSSVDTDYEVYEGELGNWYSHLQVPTFCSTGTSTTAEILAGDGDTYYLIVPTDLSSEGSYGEDSSGSERPASTAACRPQTLGNCP